MAITTSKRNKTDGKVHKHFLHKIIAALSVAFFTIWIIIGLIILFIIFANFRQGAFSGLLGSTPTTQVPNSAQAPALTDLPGVGMVDVTCVQNSLSEEAIEKLVNDEGVDNFTDEEKETLSPCVVEADDLGDSD